jgi:hypothetical protein
LTGDIDPESGVVVAEGLVEHGESGLHNRVGAVKDVGRLVRGEGALSTSSAG